MPRERRDNTGRTGIAGRCAGMLFAACALLFVLWPAAPSGASPVAEHTVQADPAKVIDGWSRHDLITARPAPMPAPPEAAFDTPQLDAGVSAAKGPFYPEDPTTYPERVQGKVFFDVGLSRYQCSGTLVSSVNGNVVYTAGHCVWDVDTKGWVQNFIFIPGYSNGTSPFQTYAASSLSTTTGYSTKGDLSYDIGMATVYGNPQADLGGARQIAFDLNPYLRKYTLYGYPAKPTPTYDGESLVGCHSLVAIRDPGTPQPMGATPCDMRQGASGGGWITDGNYLNSITSYSYCDDDPTLCNVIFGPYFSNAAKALYTNPAAGGSVTPTVKVKFSPPRVVRKRRVLFKFAGTGSTPVTFQCRLDQLAFRSCDARKLVGNLTAGKHVFRVRSTDQTGHMSAKTIKKTFRVVLKKKK